MESTLPPAVGRLLARGRARGFVTVAEVHAVAAVAHLEAEELQALVEGDGIPVVAGALEPAADPGGRSVETTADPVRLYLNEIGQVGLLDAEQEMDLAKRMAAGRAAAAVLDSPEELPPDRRALLRRIERDGDRARRRLVEANLRLVVSIAKRYVGQGMLFPDLVQEGNLGLMRAVEKFDPTKGYKFSTYATWWIRQMISRGIADQSRTIRIPVHLVELMQRLAKVQRRLLQELGREPTVEEVARAMEVEPERVEELRSLERETASLDAPIGEDGDAALSDVVEDRAAEVPLDAAAYLMLQQHLAAVLEELPERERRVIELRFGLLDGRPRTLEEVGDALGLTRERIRQIEARALAKLRHPTFAEALHGYLGD